ncbi:NAD(P)H-binding protein [Streptacidiphilus carbonis]|uniref:NAD(P)H-binding protein n=1 Tax=Streptacidiphilus carbonis TaxID=105422 RepID=UPI0005AA3F60|nr:NAD(P)H-binding protein [Streptacidiphilus carbonis]
MILVTGANGNVGTEVVRALSEAGEQVRALVRVADRPAPAGAEGVVGDLNEPESLAPALAGVRGLFLLPGYRDMPGLLAEAARAGVHRVVLLSGGSAGDGDMSNAVSRYMILSEIAVRDSGLPWTILRPAAFMSNAFRWLPQLNVGDVVRVPFAGVRTATVDPYDIGQVAARALLTDGHYGQVYYPTGPQSLLPEEQISTLGQVLGRKLECVPQSNEEARAEMTGAMPEEYVDAFFRFYVDGTLDESQVRPTVQEVTGQPPRTFAQWAEAHAGDFAPS